LGPEGRPSASSTPSPSSNRSTTSVDTTISSGTDRVLSHQTSTSSLSSTAAFSEEASASAKPRNLKPSSIEVPQTHRTVFLTEQVLHHPPVSAFYGECKSRGLIIRGYDQIAARFTGTGSWLVEFAENSGQSVSWRTQ